MGAFTSSDLQKYQARYAVPKTKPGYQSIRTGKKGPCIIKTLKQDYAGTWIVRNFESEAPSARIGHCTVHVPEFNGVVICYGNSPDGTLFGDFWYLNLSTNTWTQKNVNRAEISPRTGAKSVLIDQELWVFGGSNETGLLSDLHIVNLHDGSVRRPLTQGPQPSPRMNHVMAFSDGRILIYGGTDATVLNDLYYLDVSTLSWTQININHGRASASYALYDNHLYVYGASQTPGFLRFDFHADAELIPVSGVVPSSTIINSRLVSFDKYFLLIGGDMRGEEEERPFAPIYLYDIEARQWSIFSVVPDGETTSTKDGEIDKNGNFLIPLFSQLSAAYNPYHREVSFFLGTTSSNPPVEYVIDTAIPLSALHMRADMLSAFRQNFSG